jgi:hypothetical protein
MIEVAVAVHAKFAVTLGLPWKKKGGNEGVSGCGWVFSTSVVVWPKLAPKGNIYLCVRHVHAYAPPRTPLTHLIAKAKIAWNDGLNGSSQRAKQNKKAGGWRRIYLSSTVLRDCLNKVPCGYGRHGGKSRA